MIGIKETTSHYVPNSSIVSTDPFFIIVSTDPFYMIVSILCKPREKYYCYLCVNLIVI